MEINIVKRFRNGFIYKDGNETELQLVIPLKKIPAIYAWDSLRNWRNLLKEDTTLKITGIYHEDNSENPLIGNTLVCILKSLENNTTKLEDAYNQYWNALLNSGITNSKDRKEEYLKNLDLESISQIKQIEQMKRSQ